MNRGLREMHGMLHSLSPLELEAAEKFARSVRDRFGARVLDMRLFGSRARREAREDSDMDVWILLDEAGLGERDDISGLALDLYLEMRLNFLISPRIMSKEQYERLISLERLLPLEIEKDGIPL